MKKYENYINESKEPAYYKFITDSFGVVKNSLIREYITDNNITKLKLLLDNGLDPNNKNGEINYMIFYAIAEIKYDIVKLLLDYGADPNVKSEYYLLSPLMKIANQLTWFDRHTNKNIIELLKITKLLIDADCDLREDFFIKIDTIDNNKIKNMIYDFYNKNYPNNELIQKYVKYNTANEFNL